MFCLVCQVEELEGRESEDSAHVGAIGLALEPLASQPGGGGVSSVGEGGAAAFLKETLQFMGAKSYTKL